MSGGDAGSTSARYLTPPADGAGDAWAAEVAADGRRGSQRVMYAGEALAPDVVADLLRLPRGDSVVVRRRVMEVDGEPCELTDSYYPAAIAAGTALEGRGKIPGGAVRLLAALGHVGVTAREDVVARMPGDEERDALAMVTGQPVLELTRLTLDGEGRPFQVDIMVMAPRRQRLRYEIKIG
ncbi:UTRA domain-containing protein [Streptomyces sp. NBC_00102]|uniref:UTRA domain-containing protein n=1 Tax=Streptomyces sp. NBC_00102 TaxID=2975652 RepID=UPI00224EA9EE|nr:UTRA domain-containing protein [Streptomyces sp. NBC_00102]MCX5399140.1 UTRA domain-containing protein [Streptomyces sp. NBC_00102]